MLSFGVGVTSEYIINRNNFVTCDGVVVNKSASGREVPGSIPGLIEHHNYVAALGNMLTFFALAGYEAVRPLVGCSAGIFISTNWGLSIVHIKTKMLLL
jgi:hypothetical protein